MFVCIVVVLGVLEDKIIIEFEVRNIGENICFMNKILKERGIEVMRLLLV